MLVDRLESEGYSVVGFAEPYHAFVKECLEASEDPWTDVLLFAADRWLLKPKIADWISEGRVLIASRSIYCSLAYQSAQGIPWEEILSANRWEELRLPDLFLILDVAPEVGYARCSGLEKFEDEEFLRRVRGEYLKIAAESSMFPGRIVLIDASAPLEEVLAESLRLVRDGLDAAGLA